MDKVLTIGTAGRCFALRQDIRRVAWICEVRLGRLWPADRGLIDWLAKAPNSEIIAANDHEKFWIVAVLSQVPRSGGGEQISTSGK
jgi:hypothetical protein